MKPEDYLDKLKTALGEYRFNDARQLNDQVLPSELSQDQVKAALSMLRRKRLFPELERVAGVFAMAGNREAVVRRQWGQALLDQGRVSQALDALRAMEKDVRDNPQEGPEVRGLIGRAYKQLYVNEGGKENLRNAIKSYLPDWQAKKGQYRWNGINVAALLARAQSDGIDLEIKTKANETAASILNEITQLDEPTVWDYATAMEACVALGDWKGAQAWAAKYLPHPNADAFELASTLRQLKEVWRLAADEHGAPLVQVLEFGLLQRDGGSVELSSQKLTSSFDPRSPRRGDFEAVWGPEGYVYLTWMETLLKRCMAIARVVDRTTGQPCGTGFLVKGSSLKQEWGDAPVLATNAHVVSSNPQDQAPLAPANTAVEFTRITGRPKVNLGELVFSSPRSDLDLSVLRIEPPIGYEVVETTPYFPALPADEEPPQRIYVVGHAAGGELVVSMYDNALMGFEGPYVRYRSPTEGGSSGSPVMNRQLAVFAIHHRAVPELQANEGVLFSALNLGNRVTP